MITFQVEEQDAKQYLVYHRNPADETSRIVLGMLTNNKIERTIPFMQSQTNEDIQYRYEVTGKQTLTEFLSGTVRKQKLFSVLKGITTYRMILEEYMLDMDAVVLDSQYIFVDKKTGDVEMILLPVKHASMPMDQFFRMLIFSCRYDQTEDSSYVASFLNYFNSGEAFSLVSFEKLLHELETLNGASAIAQPAQPETQPVSQVSGIQTPKSELPPQIQPAQPVEQTLQVQKSQLSEKKSPDKPEVEENLYTEIAQPQNAEPPVKSQDAFEEAVKADPDRMVGETDTSIQFAEPVQPKEEEAGTTVLSEDLAVKTPRYVNPGLQKQRKQQTATPRYVNPNLQKAREMNGINGAGRPVAAPKTYPGTQAKGGMYAEAGGESAAEELPLKEKKSFFGKKDKKAERKPLFGKREKEQEDQPVKEKQKPVSFKGIAIPGSDVVQIPEENKEAAPQISVPAQHVDLPVHAAPIQNFGETVDLNTYVQDTTLLDAMMGKKMETPCLIRVATNERFFLTNNRMSIGRSQTQADIHITENTGIGRIHAVFYRDGEHVYMEDQQSKNGTFLNGRQISKREELHNGDRIRLSDEEFEFRMM